MNNNIPNIMFKVRDKPKNSPDRENKSKHKPAMPQIGNTNILKKTFPKDLGIKFTSFLHNKILDLFHQIIISPTTKNVEGLVIKISKRP